MSSATRREVIRRTGLGAIAAVWAFNAQSALAQGTRPVSPPTRPMRLRREIVRELIDGNELVVARSWNVRFSPSAGGWLVDGSQSEVDVHAPTELEALARLERSRRTEESFPLLLDRHGMIRHGYENSRTVGVDRLAQAARKSLASLGREDTHRSHLNAFLTQMQQASLSAMTKFPHDLFFPAREELKESKLMDLPGGLTGRMELLYRSNSDPTNGLLTSSQRSVITRIENQELRSSERWHLASA